MPELKRSSAANPLTGAGIIRYFDVEKGIKIDPMIMVGIVAAFILFEIVLKLVA